MPAHTMPAHTMPAHIMPEKCIPVCVMPVKCPEKEKEAMAPMKCPNMATSPAVVRCPEMPSGTAPAMPAPMPAPAENIDMFPVGMAYVPWQCWQEVYPIDVAINMGTIFPDLSLPFIMGGCQ
ncbi:MAG: spore coat associated protein CotJA [Lachnospiraceae bacterium]|nr:spore coat associated protein CotJA [Lachnospiraceae bacterium]MSS09428.1 spore coat associated protein CotJA [Clostridium sp. WB02_MRS01]